MAPSPCQSCGACCATLRITLPRIELESRGGHVPDALTEAYTPTTACMREHPDMPGRCIALAGTVGSEVSCTIYGKRPEACREFAPFAALGEGDDACDEARRRCGLAPLRR
jgi:Fe-S-cluster containining protein